MAWDWACGWHVRGSAGLGLFIHRRKAEKVRKGEKEGEALGRAPRKMLLWTVCLGSSGTPDCCSDLLTMRPRDDLLSHALSTLFSF